MKKYILLLLSLIVVQDTTPMQKTGSTALTSTAIIKNTKKITPSLVRYYTARSYNNNKYVAQNTLHTTYLLSHPNYMRPYIQKRKISVDTIVYGVGAGLGATVGLPAAFACIAGAVVADVACKQFTGKSIVEHVRGSKDGDTTSTTSSSNDSIKNDDNCVGYSICEEDKESDKVCIGHDIHGKPIYYFFKAPGKPTKGDGFTPPKKGDGNLRPHPETGQFGWEDKNGNWWVPSGTPAQGGHGGPHWDLVYPDGTYDNVNPGGKIRPGNSGKYKSSKLPETKPTNAAPAKPQEATNTKQTATGVVPKGSSSVASLDFTDLGPSRDSSRGSSSSSSSRGSSGSSSNTFFGSGSQHVQTQCVHTPQPQSGKL